MKAASRIKLAATVASLVRASTRPGAPGLGERVRAVPRLVRATRDHSYTGTPLRRLALVVAALAYVASPVDLVPEAVLPVLGAADDAVVLGWVVKTFLEETDRFLAWEVGQGLHHPGAARPGTADGATPVRPATRPANPERPRLPEGARQAATDHVLESVRKRLER